MSCVVTFAIVLVKKDNCKNTQKTKEKGKRIIYATNLREHPVRHFSHVPDIYPSSRENWKGWRSHECAVEFRELLNEPSSRKPLITKGLGEEVRAGGKREADIRRGPETADLS